MTWLQRQIGRGLAAAEQAPAAVDVGGDAGLPAAAGRPGLAPLAHPGNRPDPGPRRDPCSTTSASPRPSSAPGPRRRSRAGGPRRRWSTASAPWPSARSSGAGSRTPPAPPRTRWRCPWPTRYPQHGDRVGDNARLFDLVLYGDRPATPDQATGVLALDDELAGVAMSARRIDRAPCRAVPAGLRRPPPDRPGHRPGPGGRPRRGRPVRRGPADRDRPRPGQPRARTARRHSPGCSTTRASTSPWPADAEALEATAVGADTTVVVTSTELLGETTTRRLLAHTRGAPLVLVDPGPGLVETSARSSRRPGAPGRRARGPVRRPAVRRPHRGGRPGTRLSGRRLLPRTTTAPWSSERGDIVLFGLSEALTNDQILRADNAAAAVRLLGQRDRLVWYVPDHRRPPGRRRGQPRRPCSPAGSRPACGWARSPSSHWSSGAPAGSDRSPPNPCRSWSRRSRPPGPADGSTARPTTGPTRRRH